jgi:hypothetical protein
MNALFSRHGDHGHGLAAILTAVGTNGSELQMALCLFKM